MERLSRDYYFMKIAVTVANRSTCDRAMVGALLVKNNRILSTGYNGAPCGLPHCDEVGHQMEGGHCVRTVHAEVNAIIQAAVYGIAIEGCTIYVTHFPCASCAKILINARILQVVYSSAYRQDPEVLAMLERSGIQMTFLD